MFSPQAFYPFPYPALFSLRLKRVKQRGIACLVFASLSNNQPLSLLVQEIASINSSTTFKPRVPSIFSKYHPLTTKQQVSDG